MLNPGTLVVVVYRQEHAATFLLPTIIDVYFVDAWYMIGLDVLCSVYIYACGTCHSPFVPIPV